MENIERGRQQGFRLYQQNQTLEDNQFKRRKLSNLSCESLETSSDFQSSSRSSSLNNKLDNLNIQSNENQSFAYADNYINILVPKKQSLELKSNNFKKHQFKPEVLQVLEQQKNHNKYYDFDQKLLSSADQNLIITKQQLENFKVNNPAVSAPAFNLFPLNQNLTDEQKNINSDQQKIQPQNDYGALYQKLKANMPPFFLPFGQPILNIKDMLESVQQNIKSELNELDQQSSKKSNKMIGLLTEEERLKKVQLYQEKKKKRNWKYTRYDVRKDLANQRQRVQGRFIKSDKPKFQFDKIDKQYLKALQKESDRNKILENILNKGMCTNNLEDAYENIQMSDPSLQSSFNSI